MRDARAAELERGREEGPLANAGKRKSRNGGFRPVAIRLLGVKVRVGASMVVDFDGELSRTFWS
jgi:hypothetical protein